MSRALLIDAGNSRVKWALIDTASTRTVASGVFDHGDAARATPTPDRPEASASAARGGQEAPVRAFISNVAGPDAAARINTWIDARWPGLDRLWVRSSARQAGVTNGYREPSELGTDRWCGMIGAHAAYPGEHLLIATLGTATTVEALRADGYFAGGLIAPGWTLMMDSLGQRTAQLPSLDAQEATRALRAMGAAEHLGGAFACDTRTSLSEGSRAAQAAFVEYAWREAQALFDARVRCVLGGGAADAIGAALRIPFTRHDGLVLAGLALIAGESGDATT